MKSKSFLFAMLLVLLAVAAPAQKDEAEPVTRNDVVAASESVVRVALIANNPKLGEFLLGHGSGVAIAPGYVVTNAHVVAPIRESPDISISIVPSQGDRRYSGELVASDSRADLALIRLQEGVVEPLPIFTGQPGATERVAAIGYPGSVDLAENLSASDLVRPIPAVRTFGQLSGGRSRRDVDTLLHTAAMARGNSGGPLVDECGRIIGINSFGTITQENDAEFGFAISARELIPFLRRADLRPEVTTEDCIPSDEQARRAAAEERAAEADELQRRQISVLEARDRGLAGAVALIVGGALVFGGGVIALLYRNRWRLGTIVGALGLLGGTALMTLAVFVYLSRPSLALLAPESAASVAAPEEQADTAEDSSEEADEEAPEALDE